MRLADKIVFAVFAIAMVVLLFMKQCSYDIWAFLLGAVVGAVALFAMIKQSKDRKDTESEKA